MENQFLASGTCGAQGDNLTWTLTPDGTLTISGKGDMEDYEKNFSWAPWYTYRIREQIRAAVLADGVTSIGNRAFLDCTELLLVIIPDGVMSIGEWAFSACRKLALVYIPDSVTSIGNYVFCGCTSLASVNISDSVTSIGDCAFSDCNSLTALYVSAGNPAYSSLNGVLFDKAQTTLIAYPVGWQGSSYAIPDGVTSIGDYAFYYCYGLTSVTIPESVTSIGECAFATTELTEIKVMATMPPSIIADKWGLNEATFKKVRKSIPVYVPAESIEAYRTAEGWSEFTNFLPLEDKER